MLLTEKDYLKKYDIKIVILSRGRYNTITTTKLLPDYIDVIVPTSEKELYKEKIKNNIIEIPDELVGLGKVRNWVLKKFPEETIIMCDDDIDCLYCLTKEKSERIEDKEEIIQILINTAIMAKDAECRVFGFTEKDIRKYKGTDPIGLNGWVGCVIGVIGRKYNFRDDKYKVDIDFCLQNLLVERKVFINNMYHLSQQRDNNAGGNALFRTEDDYNKSLDSLLNKWGKCIKIKKVKSQIKIKTNVQRKQNIKIENK